MRTNMKSYHKDSLTRNILEHLAEGGKIALEMFFPPGYSYTDPSRRLFGLNRPCRHMFTRKEKASISSILSRLQNEGLVIRKGAKRAAVWRIAQKGRARLRMQEKKTADPRALPKSDGIPRLIVFDIPERQRQKRDWLRIELVSCGFQPLQRSVWVGTRPLPEELIRQIDEHGLGACVHVMSVAKRGTLKNIVNRGERR